MVYDINFLLQVVLELDQASYVGDDPLTASCKDSACPVPVKEAEAELVLQSLDGVAHCRGGEIQLFRSPDETAGIGDLQEDFVGI